MNRLLSLILVGLMLLCLLPQTAAAQNDEATADEATVASEPNNHMGVSAERYRAYIAYLAKHADTDGDGDFDANDIQQFERSGDLNLLRDPDLMGGYFGSGDEFISEGVEDQVNGGRYLRSRSGSDRDAKKKDDKSPRAGMNDRHSKDGQVAKLDLFGMRQFLSDADTYSSPSEAAAAQQYAHWRNLGILLTGVINSPDDLERQHKQESANRAVPPQDDAPKQYKLRYTKDDPSNW
jgi:hypothetical protein